MAPRSSKMTYEVWRLPFAGPINELRANELIIYREWFTGVMTGRMKLLNAAVSNTPGFGGWTGAATVESLEVVSDWLMRAVGSSAHVESISMNELVSMSWDVGLHMASVLIAQQGWQWQQYLVSKRIVDYGHMVVTAPNRTFRNTLRQTNVIVDRIHEGRWVSGDMLALYQRAVMEAAAPLN